MRNNECVKVVISCLQITTSKLKRRRAYTCRYLITDAGVVD